MILAHRIAPDTKPCFRQPGDAGMTNQPSAFNAAA
jgi:hypothetical protein